ncbi:MAG: TIGR03936 family radical SAM-associated protein [bacterium]|nr:TIGR03936 family radical SAM-associated protein [bacterium]
MLVNSTTPLSTFCYRITYQIVGRLRFLSHKELLRMLVRACRRARLPLAYSQGYHPHPLLSFGPPRPVGMAGTAEHVDIRLTSALDPPALVAMLGSQMPRGATVVAAHVLAPGTPAISAAVRRARYACAWPADAPAPTTAAIAALLARTALPLTRATGAGPRDVNLRPGIFDLHWAPPMLLFNLALAPDLYVRPQEVLALLTGWSDTNIRRLTITRTGMASPPTAAGTSAELYGTRNPD